jgi:hypothetical protein
LSLLRRIGCELRQRPARVLGEQLVALGVLESGSSDRCPFPPRPARCAAGRGTVRRSAVRVASPRSSSSASNRRWARHSRGARRAQPACRRDAAADAGSWIHSGKRRSRTPSSCGAAGFRSPALDCR